MSPSEEDQLDLRPYWHPVAWALEVGRSPYTTVLLGERLVIWRVGGTIVAAPDRCPHRGTALSLGAVQGQHLVCPYHGWHFDAAGMCRKVPQMTTETPIPGRTRLETYSCEERYGLIWVALEPPRFDIPAFPEWLDRAYRHVRCEPYTWSTSAGRMMENFTDFGHLGYLHNGLLGSRDDLVVAPHRVRQIGRELHYEISISVPNTNDRFAVTDLTEECGRQTNSYVLSLPFTLRLRCQYEDSGAYRTLFFAVQPRSETESTGYCYQSRNFDLAAEDAPFAEFQELLARQDKPIVESQLPKELPLEATAELQLPFDRVAIAYRRALRDLVPLGPS
jgi:phenylpropionate dioxygenase-like ring-hydroxylating dioxygenase large terminal subunit